MKKRIFVSCLIALAFAGNADATLIYSNDFDAAPYVAPGVTATLSGSGSYLGGVTGGPYAGSNGKTWAGQYFNGNGRGATLALGNLPSHTGVSIDMMLGFLNSWDSRNGGCCAPDNLDVYLDGILTLRMTTNNALGTIVDFNGGTQLVNNGQIDGWGFYSDDLVDMATAPGLTFAHAASTLSLTITPSGGGWQGWGDEGWGMDALSVRLRGTNPDPVPEPATMLLMGTGLAGLVGARRRKKS